MATSVVSLRATDRLENRLEFEQLIADLFSRFINVPPGEVDEEIEAALNRVCDFLEFDLAVLWQWSPSERGLITPTHSFSAGNLPRPTEPMRQEQYPWSRQEVLSGRTIAVASLNDLPPEAAVDRATCDLFGIRSVLCLPLRVGGEHPIGALGFNCLRAERDWPEPLVQRLQLVAQVFANALARRRTDAALRESEALNRVTFEQAAVGMAHVAVDGRWLRVNDRLCSIVGFSREELLRMSFQDITLSDDLARDLERVRQVLSGEIETYSMEKRYVRKDRSQVWINLTVSLVRDAAGRPRHFIAVVEDITERWRAELALRMSEDRLRAGADMAGLAYYEVDLSRRVAYVDERFEDVCGLPPHRRQGLQPVEFWLEGIHPDDRTRVIDEREELHGEGVPRLTTEYRFLHPSRGLRWLHHEAIVRTRDATGRAITTFGVLRDITESRLAEEELRGLSQMLIGAHEEERAMLARELHDDVTQRLAVLAIDAGRAECAALDESQAEALRAIRNGLVRLSEDIHSLAYQLHPSVLEELGLCEALDAECERLKRSSSVAFSLDLNVGNSSVAKDAAFCLFRVAQESLNNVIRHSNARSATLTIRELDGGLLLAVRDDGIGFDPVSGRSGRHLGLASMRERVRLVNGTLDIESSPGEGTAVIAWIPGKDHRDEHA